MDEYKNELNTSNVIVKNAISERNSNLAVYSLVLSIFGFIGFWIPVWNLIFSITGLVTGILCLSKKHKSQTMAVVGIVIASIALVMSLIAYILYALLLFTA